MLYATTHEAEWRSQIERRIVMVNAKELCSRRDGEAMSMKMKITTLAPWFGSNRTLASDVGTALTGCRWVGVPFAGGMSELAHIAAPSIVVNDTHRHVMNLAACAAHWRLGPVLYRKLRREAFAPDTLARSQWWLQMHGSLPNEIPDIDSAFHYFIAVWMGRSAKAGTDSEFTGGLPVRWNGNGGDSNTRYRSAVHSLVEWRRILQRCNFTVMDCFEFLAKSGDDPQNGIYCDPPFPDVGDAYRHKFTVAQHRKLAITLDGFRHTRVVCRFYDHALIRELYPKPRWNWTHHVGRKQTNAAASEVLIVSNSKE